MTTQQIETLKQVADTLKDKGFNAYVVTFSNNRQTVEVVAEMFSDDEKESIASVAKENDCDSRESTVYLEVGDTGFHEHKCIIISSK